MSRRLSVVAGVVFAVVLADTALWLAGTRVLSTGAGRWAMQAERHGWTVSWTQRGWGGWPFSARLRLGKPSIAGGERYLPGGLAWSADRVAVSISVFHPFTVRIAADGQQFLRVAHAPDIGFVAGTALVRLTLGRPHQIRGTVTLSDVTGGIAGSRYPQDVQVGAASLSLETDEDEAAADPVLAARLAMRAERIGLPDIGRWPLGATVAGAGATVVVKFPQPAANGREQDRNRLQAAAWRDGGGRVLIENADLRWGPLGVRASAALGLDSRLQPAGSGTADMRGTAPALDAASEAGLIAPGMALTAKAVLAVMTQVHGPDGDAVRLPFRVRDSIVSVGLVPVARLPDVRW